MFLTFCYLSYSELINPSDSEVTSMTRKEMLNILHNIPVKAQITYLPSEGAIECLYVTSKGTKEEWIGIDEWPASICKKGPENPATYYLVLDDGARTFTDYQSFADCFEKEYLGKVTPWEDNDDDVLESWIDELEFYEDIYLPSYLDLEYFLDCPFNSVSIDWEKTESDLGFPLQDGLKRIFSKIFSENVRGIVDFAEGFLIPTGDEDTDEFVSDWNNKYELTLIVIEDQEFAVEEIRDSFEKGAWSDESSNRVLIGKLKFDSERHVDILFNNITGHIEWRGMCRGWPVGEIGLVSNTIDEFFEKLHGIIAPST